MTTAPLAQGTCHGFQILSDIDYLTLTSGTGWPVTVYEIANRIRPTGELLLSFDEREGRLPMSIHSTATGRYEVVTASLGIFEVDAHQSTIAVPMTSDSFRREMLALGTPLALLINHHGDLALHAAGLAPTAKAVLLTGTGGAGKSTLTAAALARGWRVLGDDLVRLRVAPTVAAFQGPVVARVREPAMDVLDIGRVSQLGRAAGKVLLSPAPFPEYRSNLIDVGAVVIVGRGNRLSIAEVAPEAAIPQLWKQSFYLPNDSARESCFSLLASLVDSVPVMQLAYPHSPDALQPALDLLADTLQAND
jgi:hypothetical protein